MPVTRRQALTALAASALTTPGAPARAAVRAGTPAPDFTATDTKGTQHTLTAYLGKTIVL